jgi:putative ABC transport system permease protein
MSMDQLVSESIAPQRILMFLLSGFAGLALVIATVGVYSVMAYSVVERTQEIGIRMALGAGRHEVLRLFLQRGMAITLTGVGLGVAGACALTRVLATMLYGVRATDLATFAAVSAVLSATAFLASYIPAWRATKIDPMVALRYE